jgi:uncharacterized protein YfbU (UPF0304 family)
MFDETDNSYTDEYHRVFSGISPELSRRDCRLLQDLLDMFRVLKASLGRLDADGKKALGEHAEALLSFQGFDFNDEYEGRLADYAQHLIDTDWWQDLGRALRRRARARQLAAWPSPAC